MFFFLKGLESNLSTYFLGLGGAQALFARQEVKSPCLEETKATHIVA